MTCKIIVTFSRIATGQQQQSDSDGVDEPIFQFPQIGRDKYGRIFTRRATKIYRVVFDKRVITAKGTLPFGYQN